MKRRDFIVKGTAWIFGAELSGCSLISHKKVHIKQELSPIDSTLGGIYYPHHVYENVDAHFNPELSDEERKVMKKIRETAKVTAKNYLPPHFRFIEDWVPD